MRFRFFEVYRRRRQTSRTEVRLRIARLRATGTLLRSDMGAMGDGAPHRRRFRKILSQMQGYRFILRFSETWDEILSFEVSQGFFFLVFFYSLQIILLIYF